MKPSSPIFFSLNEPSEKKAFEELRKTEPAVLIIDTYLDQLKEYFFISNPHFAFSPDREKEWETFHAEESAETPVESLGTWVYFPWTRTLVHLLNKERFLTVRTARNRNLITIDEQSKLWNTRVAIAGMSIGSSVASSMVLSGIGQHFVLADSDILDLSNTNRIRTSVTNLGIPKIEIVARELFSINPYVTISYFTEGLSEADIESFIADSNIVIDEIDDFSIKYGLRVAARTHRLPLLSGIDVADSSIIDIERYDLSAETNPFNGRISLEGIDIHALTKPEIGKLIGSLVGAENEPERMRNSVSEVGKTLVSWPQLGTTALLNGAAIAHATRQILLGNSTPSGRQIFSFEKISI
jgi:hypothetical protein